MLGVRVPVRLHHSIRNKVGAAGTTGGEICLINGETELGEVLQWSGDRSPFQLLRKAVLGELLHAPAAKTDIWQHSSR
jgi:hypothetical protein